MPLMITAIAPESGLIPLVSGTSLVFLALLDGLAARAGGAGVTIGAMRVTFWGALAMALTASILPDTSTSDDAGMCSDTPMQLCAHSIPTPSFTALPPPIRGAANGRNGSFTLPGRPSISHRRVYAGIQIP